jgi:hypothetical protein
MSRADRTNAIDPSRQAIAHGSSRIICGFQRTLRGAASPANLRQQRCEAGVAAYFSAQNPGADISHALASLVARDVDWPTGTSRDTGHAHEFIIRQVVGTTGGSYSPT